MAAPGSSDFERIERVIRYIVARARSQPSLDELARVAGLSPHHFQRLFRRWAGISPKRFVQVLTLEHARRTLEAAKPVLDAALEAGLSGPGRLHDLFVTYEAMTPGECRRRGAGLTVRHGIHPSPFGPSLLLATARGVCGLAFVGEADAAAALERYRRRWPNAAFAHAPEATGPLASRCFGAANGEPLRLLLMGTPFQLKVWQALLAIPPGALISYGELARHLRRPTAARAVGAAVGANPIAYLIPCHRVIRETGALQGYAWGLTRKQAMIAREAAQAESSLPRSPAPAR
ncbi:MAG TPA: methylated-DNA--[protein]-cysteine S-methyltransferase [Alphaproteobacteria bacterium]|nr:methylated-DNA--[protein]-cysteine S-methyltransferase [Alphaproteobacteria bacterium]